jgi:spectinomycin phosphotransferase
MLTPPALSANTIIACVRERYALRIAQVTFLPLGADVNTAVYRVEAADGMPYFLKLRRGDFDEVAVAVPAFLRAQGIRQVMAPIATTKDQLWVSEHGFVWVLYPFVEGANACEAPLSPAQWVALGAALKAVHAAVLPAALSQRVPREDFTSRWREIVMGFDRQVETSSYNDPIARDLATSWLTQRHEIRAMVERAARLGRDLERRAGAFVLCHTDLHAWNVLVGANGELSIVDWDAPILEPKERDLMFVGGGIGGVWNEPQEEAWFYSGYGSPESDPVALSYYRYERIVEDLASYGAQIFGAQGSAEDRENGLRKVIGQYLPHEVVDIAHQTYQRLPFSRDGG